MDTEKSSMVVGRIAGAYGIKGWLRVSSYTEPQDNILGYIPWQLCSAKDGTVKLETNPVRSKPHGKGFVVQLEGVADRDAADELRGLEIRVQRKKLPEPEKGSFYWADLEGLRVYLTDGSELGRIDHLLDTGATDVMVIVGKYRVLIPFVYGDTVKKVDLDAGVMTVDWDIAESDADEGTG